MRLVLLLAALAAALGLAVITTQTPRPAPTSAAATGFSAERAMADVRVMARSPRPIGSTDHALVQAYLQGRMAQLGLAPTLQAGALSPAAVRRIEDRGESVEGLSVVNLVGVLPGRNPSLPLVVLMAHYDSVPGSPGAADDASGVAAVLGMDDVVVVRSGDAVLVCPRARSEEVKGMLEEVRRRFPALA